MCQQQVFTSASSAVFKTFACDDGVVNGESYLRADYSISCQSRRHGFFRLYAGLMILVYPIGIPALFLFVLWTKRELLNPRVYSGGKPEGDGVNNRVKARMEHPELVPFMFLWRDFGPDLYYYEVVECGRRILLTEVLIFIAPHTSIQAAMACIFAFVSLLGFELMRPHADPAD
ncbi:unnamed protein product, partial [Laminaria digitata]